MMIGIFHIALIYLKSGQYIEAVESYRSCKWYYQIEKNYYMKQCPSPLESIIYENICDEIKLLEARNKIENKQPQNELIEASPHPEEITTKIDFLWSQSPVVAKQNYSNAKEVRDSSNSTFKVILQTVNHPRKATPKEQRKSNKIPSVFPSSNLNKNPVRHQRTS